MRGASIVQEARLGVAINLGQVLVERDTGLRIEDGGMWVTIQVRRYNVILRVSQNA